MNRRNFCRLSALTALMGLASGSAIAAVTKPRIRCKVTVVRRHCFEDLQSCYLDDPEAGACPVFMDGFSSEFDLGGAMPVHGRDRMCPKAWAALCECAESSFGGGAITSTDAVLASCGDPTRPVVFKLERIRSI